MQVILEELYAKEYDFYSKFKPNHTYTPGKSIVTSCYGGELPSAWVMLQELKRLKNTLPIEIFHKPGELTTKQIQLLESVDPGLVKVKTIQGDPKNFISKYGHSHGWSCKIYSLYESEYEENLWIDADNCPIRNPTFLFYDDEYKAKGSLFWRDIMSVDSADTFCQAGPVWKVFNIPYNDSELCDSGQLVINKNKCALQFGFLKFYADNCEVYYNFGGDKETFRLAWQRVAVLQGWRPYHINALSDPNLPYGFIPFGPFHKGHSNQYKKWGGGSVMVQRDRYGKELFNHRNLSKFKLGKNTYMDDVPNEEYYHEHINHLNEIYSGD